MEKIKVALLLSGFEGFGDKHLIEGLKEFFTDENLELKVIHIDLQNVERTVKEIEEYKPHFSLDFNTKGIIWGEKENQKYPLHTLLGIVHLTIFTEDPILHASNILQLHSNPNIVFLITDLRYGEFLTSLGFQNIYYFTPCVNFRLIPPKENKEISISFVGNVIDPNFLIETWNQSMDSPIRDFGIEVGEFCFRNPEITPIYAVEYILPLMNPQFQERFNEFRKNNPVGYFLWLSQVSLYSSARRNWFILNFLEGTDITIIGNVEGNLPEDFKIVNISSFEDRISLINRSKLALTAFPTFVPSGIGFTPLEIAACETALMINYRHTLSSFFKPNEEVITYNPLDRMDIEEKILFYLENEEDRLLIAQKGFKTVQEKFTCNDRIEFIKTLIKEIYKELSLKRNKNNSEENTLPS